MGPASGSLGGRQLAWLIFQPGDPVLFIAVQPDAHHILAAGMDGSDLGNSETAVGEQNQVGAQGHAPDSLPTDDAEFVPLTFGKMHVDHPVDLLLSQAAK